MFVGNREDVCYLSCLKVHTLAQFPNLLGVDEIHFAERLEAMGKHWYLQGNQIIPRFFRS